MNYRTPFLAVIMLPLVFLTGCSAFFQPIPVVDRTGDFYCYTKHYKEDWLRFNLLGKCMRPKGSHPEWGIPSPPRLLWLCVHTLLHSSLFAVEEYVLCPFVDTAMIPYDMMLVLRNKYKCANDGILVRITDQNGNPVANAEVTSSISSNAGGGYFAYDGEVLYSKNIVTKIGHTDKDGFWYVPIGLNENTDVYLKICDGNERCNIKAVSCSDAGWHPDDSHWHKCHTWGSSSVDIEHLQKMQFKCARCYTGKQWTSTGKCVKCGKETPAGEKMRRIRNLSQSPVSLIKAEDFAKAAELTGVSADVLRQYLGYSKRCEKTDRVIVVRSSRRPPSLQRTGNQRKE